MDSTEELRNKRLDYYNKILAVSNSRFEPSKNGRKKNALHSSTSDLATSKTLTNHSEEKNNLKQSISSSVKNKAELLDKIFGAGDLTTTATKTNHDNKPPKLNQSLSLDESTSDRHSMPSGNRKLEEFKRVVESSYEKHVLNKQSDNLSTNRSSNYNTHFVPELFRTASIQSEWLLSPTETNKPSIFNAQLSAVDSSRSNEVNNIHTNSVQFDSESSMMGAKTLPCKIPYMSAYNIYNLDNHDVMSVVTTARANVAEPIKLDINNNQAVMIDSFFNKKILTSNGSSLNTSPTSISSNESGIRETELASKTTTPREIKPPDTPKPKSAGLTFRKNLVLRRTSNPKQSDLIDSLEITKPKSTKTTEDLNIKNKKEPEFELDQNNWVAPPKTPETNDNIFKNDNNDDSDSGSDTFDIFSSQESLKNENVAKLDESSQIKKPLEKINLSIDLSGLRSDDEEDFIKKKVEEEKKENEDDDNEDNFIITTSRNPSSSRRQIKPDNIPNLALDLFDDDKSQSVTVSLAKSMCNEINYKKEMEAIISKDNLPQPSQLNKSINKLKPINIESYRKLKKEFKSSQQINSTNSSKKQDLNNTSRFKVENSPRNANIQSYFLKPIASPSENTPNRSNSSTDQNINIQPSISQNGIKANSNLAVAQSTAFEKNKRNSEAILVKNNLKKSVSHLKSMNISNETTQNRYWQSSSKLPFSNNKLRSSSAQLTRSDALQSSQTKPPLFLNYSKLVSIEANMQKETLNNNSTELNRPKSSSAIVNNPKKNSIFEASSSFLKSNEDFQLKSQLSWTPPIAKELNVSNEQEKVVENEMENEEPSRWLNLPDEIWLSILSYLKHSDLIHFGRACKKFNHLYIDNSLWRKISVKYKYEMCDEWLDWIGMRRPNELNIIQCSGNLTLSAISEMFRNIGENLTTLNLSRCSNGSLSGDNFALQASIRCPNITNLDLSWTLLSNQTLKLIVDSFKKIEIINLSGCNMIQEDGFNLLLVKHGENIKSLEISGCIHFSSNCLINIGAYCRNIEKLNISNCHRMTNEALMESCQYWIKLKYIDFKGIKNIKNSCISLIVRKCPRLESIALGECVNLGDSSILEIATYKPNIKYIDANGCKKITDNILRSLASFCNKLEYLNIRATNITDSGIITLANGNCISNLEEINLSYLQISEHVLIKLLKNGKKIKRVHLYGCYNIKNIENIRQSLGEKSNMLEINI